LILAVPTLVAVLTSVLVWRRSASTGGTRKPGGRLRTSVRVLYVTAGAVLAVTRIALFLWVVDQQAHHHVYTRVNMFISEWLYPEMVVSIVWRSLVAYGGAKYYLAWCSLFAVGSFVMATPILLVGWLRQVGSDKQTAAL
jgi:hypothetical protein